jgi:hypothetical protein
MAKAVGSHCLFSIREATSVTMTAGDMQAMTDVSETAQRLMSACEGAMTTMNCADTYSGAHDSASNDFEEASSQLEELGFEYEITSDRVFFSRSDTIVEEYDPATRIGAAPFLGLTGTVELGALDQVIDVSDYKGRHRCPVLARWGWGHRLGSSALLAGAQAARRCWREFASARNAIATCC